MFAYLKYVRPAWYFRLYAAAARPLYSKASLRQAVEDGLLLPDEGYASPAARDADLVFQAIRAGWIRRPDGPADDFTIQTVTDVFDNHRFLRKYHAGKWSVVALIAGILSGHHPFREIKAFLRARRGVKRSPVPATSLYEDFPAQAIAATDTTEKVSVIIPTLNRYAYLKDVMADLEAQTYRNFEVVVCDQSDPFDPKVYEGWTYPVTVLRQSEKALWMARNRCIRESSGRLILLFDDDSRVSPEWIRMHVACLSYFGCDISAGVTHTVVGNRLSERDSRFHYAEVFDTGNALLRRSVFEVTGLFDRQFEKQRMGDGEFGLRAYLNGFPSISNPHARRTHLKIETGGLREFGSWDAFRPRNLFSPRPVPSVLYFSRRYFGDDSAIMLVANSIVSSVIPYKYKNDSRMKRLSIVLFIPLLPIVAIQVLRSWRQAGAKLHKGPLIEALTTGTPASQSFPEEGSGSRHTA